MTKIESVVNLALERLKDELAESTWEARRYYYVQLLRCAESIGISEPCLELYEAFIADDKGSTERRSQLVRCVKIIDGIAGTNARNDCGILYNEPTMPSETEVQEFFCDQEYPILTDVCIDYIIVKSEIELRYLQLTSSTIGQYKNSWMDIRRYFYDSGTTGYDEALLLKYIHRNNILRNNGSIEEWKWKIKRKSAFVLIEVANSGSFRWKHITKETNCEFAEFETIRLQYLTTLKERNLRKSTISLHDYVFRKALKYAGVKSADDFASLSPASIQLIILNFSDVCNRRSMATILPILRSMLGYLNKTGFIGADLSGIVMGAFAHRGSVATYISEADQEKIITQLDKEPKRNKAIILLALKLGLRDSDICNLAFEDIDWRKDIIKLNQEKTGEPLILPLLPDVGNALLDYIFSERPKRSDHYPYLFLRSQAPFNKLNSVYHICSRFLERLKIEPINGKAKGAHTFRYSMVYRLLSAKVPHQVITDVLGHSSKESDKPYISMGEPMLRMCALDLSTIGRVSWNGGPKND